MDEGLVHGAGNGFCVLYKYNTSPTECGTRAMVVLELGLGDQTVWSA